jgi:hypothetical protein
MQKGFDQPSALIYSKTITNFHLRIYGFYGFYGFDADFIISKIRKSVDKNS